MKKINTELKFGMGEMVYYKTDMTNNPGLVVGALINMDGTVNYRISFSGEIAYCYAQELRIEKVY